MEKCIICLDADAMIKVSPCRHQNFCLECILQIKIRQDKCPCCRGEIRNLICCCGQDNCRHKVSKKCGRYIFSKSPLIFSQFLTDYLTMQNLETCDMNGVIKTISDTYQECQRSTLWPHGLSVDQIETYLSLVQTQLNGAYKLRKLLVALCQTPWLISGKLGGCGVCYHGNLGETPQIMECYDLLMKNFNSIKTRQF